MAKTTRYKASQARTTRRRVDLRRALPREGIDLRSVVYRADLLKAVGIILLFLVVTTVLVNWSREQIRVVEGQLMSDTRLARIDYTVVDEDATRARREAARREAPRVYRLNQNHLDEVEAALKGLPKAVAGRTSVEEIRDELAEEFSLDSEGLETLQRYIENGETAVQWRRWAERLTREQLRRRPLIESQEYPTFITTLNLALRLPDGELRRQIRGDLIDPVDLHRENWNDVEENLTASISAAGFPRNVIPYIKSRLLHDPQPTFIFDEHETHRIRDEAAGTVEKVLIEYERGEVLYRRGDVLTNKQLDELETERAMFLGNASPSERWLPQLGVFGLIALLTIFLTAQVMLVYPRVTRNAMRIAAIGALMAGMLALSAVVSARASNLMPAAAVAPTLLVAIVVLLAYDQRLALFLSGMQCLLVTLALGLSIGWFILLMAACGTMILLLHDLRHRNSLIRAALITAAVLAVGIALLGVFELPLMPQAIFSLALTQIMMNAMWVAIGSIAIGFLMLGILPLVERAFDITTGMTLAELRDPRQPLLRQLQQIAPGTYNHSLQVANIAEAAADAIGADSLQVYVGALYHDIGKLNKPDYFVENQAGGASKHAKLSPAMSLLVIVGHVKDGIELAREYGLPREIIHFIESHHGTTLVEYFYHAAKSQQKPDDRSNVTELEFRYPGPKPRAKEAAIMMLADGVESATRAMADPNPSRIETLVRDMSHKRLMDGQFDQCDLTFRELGLIEDSMISRLCAIHHGRISYPSSAPRRTEPEHEPRVPEVPKQVSA